MYRYNWACVDAHKNGHALPGVNCQFVAERLRALNWLIGYRCQEWDDVSTDS
jgi:hypothetical protein